MTEEIKLVTSLHKKSLRPFKEGKAFAAYHETNKATPEQLAKRPKKTL